MKHFRLNESHPGGFWLALFLTASITILVGIAHAAPAPLGTAITYQGQLKDGGTLAAGSYDMEFNLYDGSDPLLAVLMGSQSEDGVQVSNGVFTVELDFGSVYDGEARWLEIGVKPAGDPGLYTYLAPLQPLTAVPQALFALEGNEGPAGATGPTGEPGPSGPIGPEGVTGASGPAGPTGTEGPSGPIGPTGLSGPAGETGADGPSGPAGDTGPSGPSGPAGLTGPSGPVGATGAAGDVGATGPVGSTGPQGDPGAVGATGPQGPLGPSGPEGTTGAAGDPGTAGRSVLNGTGDPDDALGEDGDFYLDTSASAMWGPKASGSWAATGPVPLVGPTGPAGPSGPSGPQGPVGEIGATGVQGPVGPEGPAGTFSGTFVGPVTFQGDAEVQGDVLVNGGGLTVTGPVQAPSFTHNYCYATSDTGHDLYSSTWTDLAGMSSCEMTTYGRPLKVTMNFSVIGVHHGGIRLLMDGVTVLGSNPTYGFDFVIPSTDSVRLHRNIMRVVQVPAGAHSFVVQIRSQSDGSRFYIDSGNAAQYYSGFHLLIEEL